MTKKEALDLYIMYDLEPWYHADLERRMGVHLPLRLSTELQKKSFLLFYDEVKNTSKEEWEKVLEGGE